MAERQIICVTGAGGFVGRHLVRELNRDPRVQLRLLRHTSEIEADGAYRGDLHDAGSLGGFLANADVLINLVGPADGPDSESHKRAIKNLAGAVRTAGIRRVVHVSTAIVVGRCSDKVITESASCTPCDTYAWAKLEAEQLLREHLGSAVELGILRPTTIVGEGSRNLRKLAATIAAAPSWKRHALRFLHGGRQLHLVSVEQVVAALLFLAHDPAPLDGEILIVAADEDPLNNYQAIDAHLGRLLGKPTAGRSFAAPGVLLWLLLRLTGRPLCDPEQRFSSQKLAMRGFRHQQDLDVSIARFAAQLDGGGSAA